MNKHTPGPWINDGDTISARPAPEESQSYIAPVCTMDPDWSPEIVAANARLIAAAPDLLAALQQCLPLVDGYRRMMGGDGDISAMNARAAIAKATGGA